MIVVLVSIPRHGCFYVDVLFMRVASGRNYFDARCTVLCFTQVFQQEPDRVSAEEASRRSLQLTRGK